MANCPILHDFRDPFTGTNVGSVPRLTVTVTVGGLLGGVSVALVEDIPDVEDTKVEVETTDGVGEGMVNIVDVMVSDGGGVGRGGGKAIGPAGPIGPTRNVQDFANVYRDSIWSLSKRKRDVTEH
ncbi:hypothetical protein RhiJN_22589 [Ceratobasidium sp. AG-Ba]|nr:hypothetical protein RhiJN_22589 [Ceratobasidium sp. AG-Ba]